MAKIAVMNVNNVCEIMINNGHVINNGQQLSCGNGENAASVAANVA
jgi:hypothetical protein